MKEYKKPTLMVESLVQNEKVSDGEEVIVSANEGWLEKLTSGDN